MANPGEMIETDSQRSAPRSLENDFRIHVGCIMSLGNPGKPVWFGELIKQKERGKI